MFLEERDVTPAQAARKAGLPNPNSLYNFLNGVSRTMSQVTVERLCRAFAASPAEMFGEQRAEARAVPMVPVMLEAAANGWRRTYEVARRRPALMPVPPGITVDEAAVITDRHADQLYRPGTMVGIQNLGTLGKRGLMHGDKVLLHRVRAGQHEVTIRVIVEQGGPTNRTAELAYSTTDKRFGSRLPIPIWPGYAGEWWENEGDRMQIRGRVILGLLLDDDA